MKSFVSLIIAGCITIASHANSAGCIGVVTSGSGKGFWDNVMAGAKSAGKELSIEVYVRGPLDESNETAQLPIIDNVVKMGCQGLVLSPISEALLPDVTRLKELNIPTVFIDRDLGGDRVSVLKTENFSAGLLAGKKMAAALGNKGRVAILRNKASIVTTNAREEGFIKGATENGLTIIVDEYIGTSVGSARTKSRKLLEVHTLDGVFTPNETTSVGVMKTLERISPKKRSANGILHIGFDSHEGMIKAVQEGRMHGFVAQQPFQMGFLGVHTVYKASKKQAFQKQVDTGVKFVDAKNIHTQEIKTLLNLE